MAKNNKKTEVEKLKTEIERLKKELKKKKKYGLVWEGKPEELVEMCKEKLPVLKEEERNRGQLYFLISTYFHIFAIILECQDH